MEGATVQLGERVGNRYELRELLGEGAMGRVFLGFDPKLHREVAIKVIREEFLVDAERRAFFHREARAAAALSHPNVVEVYDYSGPKEDTQYIVFERLVGLDLGTVLETLGALPEPVVAAVGHEVCFALKSAHDEGLIHRDLKPDNRAARQQLRDYV